MSEQGQKPKSEWVGPSEYARYRGVALKTLKDWIKDGRLENCFKTGSNNRKKINWQLADQALENSSGEREKDSTTSDKNAHVGTLTKARTAKTAMEAQAAKLKFELLAGSLVKKSDVVNVAKDMGRLTKESLMTLPDRMAPVLAGMNDIDDIHKLITEEINTALRNLATTNYEFFKDDQDGNS